jgi:DNA-binding beta-propeller fold protein YncE
MGNADGPGAKATFSQPTGVALDDTGTKLYVADSNNRSIRVVDLVKGMVSTLAVSAAPGAAFSGFGAPYGIAFDRGSLYVTDYSSNLVDAIDLAHGRVSTLAGQFGLSGNADGTGSAASFFGPVSVTADGRGNLYVADNQSQTIRRIVIATRAVSTIAGQAYQTGDADGTGSAAKFQSPQGVAANGVGELFVSDTLNNTVRHIDTTSQAVTTVIGSPKLWGVRVGALPAQITQPTALALMPSGALLLISENSLLMAH